MRWLALLVALFAAPALAQNYWEPHWVSRLATVQMETNTVGQNKTVLYGDSNSEAFWWSINNSCWYVNAGFGGATIRALADRAASVATATKPRTVHIMVGTNNLGMDHAEPEWTSMAADLHTITSAFQAQGSKIVLWYVPPMSQSVAPANYAADRAHINGLIQAEAVAINAYYDWWWPDTFKAANGYATAGSLTADGIHFSATTQASRFSRLQTWRQQIKTDTGMECQ
jgi:lysophospholipase L1-like esterase